MNQHIHINSLWIACLLILGLASCSDDKESLLVLEPQASGIFVDERDGHSYNWVRIGSLDWMCDNAAYNLDDNANCTFYVPYSDWEESYPEDVMSEKYGFLYTYQGALAAAPDGWRMPSDEDWQRLERALGMPTAQTAGLEWRGQGVAPLLMQQGEGTRLGLQLGGYYTSYLGSYDPHYWYLGAYGVYWTSTKDEAKDGEYYFYRKLSYHSDRVYRQSMEPSAYMLSVRFVRDAQ